MTEALRITARTALATLPDGSELRVRYVRDEYDGFSFGTRRVFAWSVIDGSDVLLSSAEDLRSGCSAEIDARAMLGTLCSFLLAAAEAYRSWLLGRSSDNSDLFALPVMEWAYQNEDEISMLEFDIDES